ncbi:hypothetical protein LTR17_022422 [Elasticomyces elasticus]|nr:hypothetical protein LTR17_022422 [Elasticomyces elasticus]
MANRRTLAATFDDIPGKLPKTTVPADTNLEDAADTALLALNSWSVANLSNDVIWRDLLAFTGTYRTFHSARKVFDTFQRLSVAEQRSEFQRHSGTPRISRSLDDSSWIDVDVEFTVQHGGLVGRCVGTVSIALGARNHWQIWMLRTWLECFDGHGNPDVPRQMQSLPNGTVRHDTPDGHELKTSKVYDAIIIGGGQCGLSVAGRLDALGLNYLLLEKNSRIGDIWKYRYQSLKWHTIKEYGNLPFGHTFSEDDPDLLSASQIAEGHRVWAEMHGINVHTDSTVQVASWNDVTNLWSVEVSEQGSRAIYTSKNVILSIGGGSSSPVLPSWAQPEHVASSGFAGEIMHSNLYQTSKPWAGKRGIVVGTANTGHDVAEDMADARMETTMIQRGSTFVMPAEWLRAGHIVDYNMNKSPERADREAFTYPSKISREMINRAVHRAVQENPERFDALERAGFRVDRFGDISNNLYVRIGGHYVDTGASARVANGEIKMVTKAVQRLTGGGLLFEDGSKLDADVIVLATGFNHDFRDQARSILGDIAEQMDDYWGIDAEGETRTHTTTAATSERLDGIRDS